MPWSSAMTIFLSPNLFRTTSVISVNAAGSAVFPPKTRTATGRPSGSVSSPYSICSLPFAAVAGVAALAQRAARALQPERRQAGQGHPVRVRLQGQVTAGQPRLDRVLPGMQPVHRRVHVVGGRLVPPRQYYSNIFWLMSPRAAAASTHPGAESPLLREARTPTGILVHKERDAAQSLAIQPLTPGCRYRRSTQPVAAAGSISSHNWPGTIHGGCWLFLALAPNRQRSPVLPRPTVRGSSRCSSERSPAGSGRTATVGRTARRTSGSGPGR